MRGRRVLPVLAVGAAALSLAAGASALTKPHLALPAVTQMSPTQGPPGTAVTLTGSALTGASAVKFNGTTAKFTVASSTRITATVPAAATTGPVQVTTPGGTATAPMSFEVLPPKPSISSFAPTKGGVGTTVTITGKNLSNASEVDFGLTEALPTGSTATTVTAVVPLGTLTGKLSVVTPGGIATSTSSFTFLPPPSITAFSPASGKAGSTVTITGTNLANLRSVTFNGVAATVTRSTATGISVKVPAGSTTGPIAVLTAGGSATAPTTFTVIAAVPTITSFAPTSGVAGTSVAISGTSFLDVSAVTFGGAAAEFTVDSPTSIHATVPDGGLVGPIAVTTPAGTATSSTSFGVGPTVTSFAPAGGAIGAMVELDGSSLLQNGGAGAVLKFNGVTAHIDSLTATQVLTTVPGGATTGPITLTTAGGAWTSSTDFHVYANAVEYSSSLQLPLGVTHWGDGATNVYILDGPVVIGSGSTLDIAAGTVIKSVQDALQVEGGTLDVEGSAGAPVRFTSAKDDTAGGDTNGDGSATSPSTMSATYVTADSGSSVDVEHATLAPYADYSEQITGATSFTMKNSDAKGEVHVSGPVPSLAIRATTFEGGQVEGALDLTGLALTTAAVPFTGTARNRFTGAMRTVYLNHDSVGAGATFAIGPDGGATFRTGLASTIDGTLTVEPGTQVGGEFGSFTVSRHGQLTASGTAALPIALTGPAITGTGTVVVRHGAANVSIGDGSQDCGGLVATDASGSFANDGCAYSIARSSGDFSLADVDPTKLLLDGSADGNFASTLTLTNDTVPAAASWDVHGDKASTISVTGLTISGSATFGSFAGIQLHGTDALVVDHGGSLTSQASFTGLAGSILVRGAATFSGGSVPQLQFDDGGSGCGSLTIADSDIYMPLLVDGCSDFSIVRDRITRAITIREADPSGLQLAGADASHLWNATGGAAYFETDEATIPAGKMWEIGGSGETIVARHLLVDGTLKLDAGTIVKSDVADAVHVAAGGAIVATGSSDAPVVLTSLGDDTAGGHTYVAESSEPASAGDWGGVEIETADGDSSFTDTVFRYAATALTVDDLTQLEVDGSQFAYDTSALAVSATEDNDPYVSSGACAPPFTAFVTGSGDWFGAAGTPDDDGSVADLPGYAGLTVPAPYDSLYAATSAAIAPHTDGLNTVPWTLFSCMDVPPFPVTPALWTLAGSAPYPALAEQ